jgi:hypothetical protein
MWNPLHFDVKSAHCGAETTHSDAESCHSDAESVHSDADSTHCSLLLTVVRNPDTQMQSLSPKMSKVNEFMPLENSIKAL